MKETSGNQETELCSLHSSIIVLFSVILFGSFRVLVRSRRDNCFHFPQAYDQPIAIVPIDENKLINHLLKLMII